MHYAALVTRKETEEEKMVQVCWRKCVHYFEEVKLNEGRGGIELTKTAFAREIVKYRNAALK